MRLTFSSIAAITASLMLAAFGGSAGTAAPESPTSAQSACSQAQQQAQPGKTYPQALAFDQSTSQRYWTVVPKGFDSSKPAPLYLLLAPGPTGDASEQYDAWGAWFSETPGLLVVADGPRYGGGASSVSTLNAVLDRVETDYCIDTAHVHVIGASSSATAAVEFACAASDRVASLAESIGSFPADACQGSPATPASGAPGERPVPIVAITGDADQTDVSQSVSTWAQAYGCDSSPLTTSLGSDITRSEYKGCAADLVLYDAESMAHQLPMHDCGPFTDDYCTPYKEIDAVEIWTSFFGSHPLN